MPIIRKSFSNEFLLTSSCCLWNQPTFERSRVFLLLVYAKHWVNNLVCWGWGHSKTSVAHNYAQPEKHKKVFFFLSAHDSQKCACFQEKGCFWILLRGYDDVGVTFFQTTLFHKRCYSNKSCLVHHIGCKTVKYLLGYVLKTCVVHVYNTSIQIYPPPHRVWGNKQQ